MIAQFPFSPDGAPVPGGAVPPLNPVLIMVPISEPSLFRISKKCSRIAIRVISAIAPPFEGVGPETIARVRPTYVPFTGLPFTAVISAMSVTTAKFLGVAAWVMVALVAKSEGSEMSAW